VKSSARSASRSACRRLGGADGDHLGGEVPFGDGGGGVEPFVALQADQAAAQGGGEGLGDLGLAGAGLAFQEQRAAQFEARGRPPWPARGRRHSPAPPEGQAGFRPRRCPSPGEWRSLAIFCPPGVNGRGLPRTRAGMAGPGAERSGGQVLVRPGGGVAVARQPVAEGASGARAGAVGPDEIVAAGGRSRGPKRGAAAFGKVAAARKVGTRPRPCRGSRLGQGGELVEPHAPHQGEGPPPRGGQASGPSRRAAVEHAGAGGARPHRSARQPGKPGAATAMTSSSMSFR
jgi:hypothetical protein